MAKFLSVEARYEKLVFEVSRLCALFGLSKSVKDELNLLCLKAIKSNATQGREVERLVACFIYYLARRDNLPLTMGGIANKLGVDKYFLFRSYKRLLRKMKLKNNHNRFESLIFKHNNELRFPQKLLTEVIRTYGELRREYGYSPRTIIGASFYLVSKKHKLKKSQEEIARACNISNSALRGLYNKLKD